MFIVTGGEYTATDFVELVPGSAETYGPFDNYDDAYDVWNGRTWARVDTCCHRLFIKVEE